MSDKSRKEIQKQNIKKAYFDFWRIQNNPAYIEFWKKVKSLGDEVFKKYIFDPPMKKGETYPEWFMRTEAQGKGKKESWFVKEMKSFGVWLPLPDPQKKINWINFDENPDKDIIESMTCAYGYNVHLRERFPIMIDPLLDDYEIKGQVEIYVKFLLTWMKTAGKIKPASRDQINKYHLYAQVWDLRKPPRKTFPEIASMLKIHSSTAKSMLQKAYELIFNEPFDRKAYEQKIKKLIKKNDLKLCNTCSDHTCIKEGRFKNYCPDMMFHLKQLEKPQTEKIMMGDYVGKDGKKISKIEWLSNKDMFRKWQKKAK